MNPEGLAIQQIVRRATVARLATLSRSGRPAVTPIYFIQAGGHIWLGTVDWTLAARNVKTNPRVSVLLAIENQDPHRVLVRIRGRAVLRTDTRTQRKYSRRVARKYLLTADGLRDYLGHIPQLRPMHYYHADNAVRGQACVIDVAAEHIELLDGA